VSRLRRIVRICGSQNRGGMGLGCPFLKPLSICLSGAWSAIWSLTQFRQREMGTCGRKLRYLTTARHFLFCETGSFGKASFAPAPHLWDSLHITFIAAIGCIGR
jgi:hypothetical protein